MIDKAIELLNSLYDNGDLSVDQHGPILKALSGYASLVAAVTRYLELSPDCDYVDGVPDVCPGVVTCHWCELRAALRASHE